MRLQFVPQLQVLLVLWCVHAGVTLLITQWETLEELLQLLGVASYVAVSTGIVSLLSLVAYGLHRRRGLRLCASPGLNRGLVALLSIAMANLAYWTLTVPLFFVLLQLGLVGK